VPKTLGEIAIEAGLVNKASAAKAGRMAEERREPLVVVLVRELGVDELALVGALRKQTRVPLLDPASVMLDAEALRQVPREMCARLRVLPLSWTIDGGGKLLRLAMADPTDTSAVAEIEQLVHGDVDVSALPLSAIDELVERGYRQGATAITGRPGNPGATMFVTARGKLPTETESEVSVTAQIPVASLQPPDDLEARLAALVRVLVAKGVLSEAELADELRKGRP
jgi:Type II secretion system (T2SS), protein E, N-terminal domain